MVSKRMCSIDFYDDDDFLEDLTRDQICAYHYLSMHTDSIGVVKKPKSTLRDLGFSDDEIPIILTNLCEKGYIAEFESDGKTRYLDMFFFVHNNETNKEAKSMYGDDVSKFFTVSTTNKSGDRSYKRKNADDNAELNGLSNIEQEQALPQIRGQAFDDAELNEIYDACPSEYKYNRDAIEDAYHNLLDNGESSVQIKYAVNYYYYNMNKTGKKLNLDKFLSDKKNVQKAYADYRINKR